MSNITHVIVVVIQQDARHVGINLIGQNPAANRTKKGEITASSVSYLTNKSVSQKKQPCFTIHVYRLRDVH